MPPRSSPAQTFPAHLFPFSRAVSPMAQPPTPAFAAEARLPAAEKGEPSPKNRLHERRRTHRVGVGEMVLREGGLMPSPPTALILSHSQSHTSLSKGARAKQHENHGHHATECAEASRFGLDAAFARGGANHRARNLLKELTKHVVSPWCR